MSDTSIKLIVWGVITLVSIVMAFICYRWLSNVARFENRKKEIALGMVVCVLAISSLMFMPVLFSRIDLHQTGRELFDQIQFAEMDAEDFLYVSEGCLSKSRSYLGDFRGYEAKGDRARRSGGQNYGYPGLV